MNQIIKIKQEHFSYYSLSASIFLHVVIFIAAAAVMSISFQMPDSNAGYVEVQTNIIETAPEIKSVEKKPEPVEEEPVPNEEKPDEKVVEKEIENMSAYLAFNPENTDTNNLINIYKESSLNVSIKYPAGWTYIDQNVKNKLDGVTFVAANANYNPPPYVHLAVQDKYIFNESKYKYKLKTRNYTAFYNDPEELSGQVSQTFYIRTDDDEDYSIKFIMKGRDKFKSLQPVFFGMVKSFNFGSSLF